MMQAPIGTSAFAAASLAAFSATLIHLSSRSSIVKILIGRAAGRKRKRAAGLPYRGGKPLHPWSERNIL
jgi:hypothetical protein